MSAPTTDELRIITDIWIETFATETERGNARLRESVATTCARVLTEDIVVDETHPSNDCWRALRAMLAAYRKGAEK